MARPSFLSSGRRRWLAVAVVLASAGTGTYVWYRGATLEAAPMWRTAAIARGPITATVSATGTLNARVTVPVGSQVSGQIRELHADFNAEVRKGQLIARIDPETFEYRVRQAQADLEAARAQVLTAQANVNAAAAAVSRISVNLAEATRDVERKRQLVERGFIASAELDRARAVMDAATEEQRSARAQVEVTQAQTRSAQAVVAQREAQLASARVDLERTAIRAPVDGIVIKRSIDAGQTVAASLQAPELFVIARDLRDMQVDTSIDEAEIGRIRLGQRASFTVDSYPGRSFSGTVAQVRKAAQTVQNVVTYTVVVTTANPDLALIPGMTANVRIVVDTRDDVLKVPNAALRFRPPDWKEPGASDINAATAATATAKSAISTTGSAGQPAASQSASGTAAQAGAGGSSGAGAQTAGAGSPLQQFRARLERELAFTDDQRVQLDAIFAAMREKFATLREAPEADRGRLLERYRGELRERIADILSADQKPKYAAIIAEIVGRQSGRGRLFVPGDDGKPRAVAVRTGLTDGAFTEVSADGLKEGDTVLVGVQGAAATGAPVRPAAGGPPRLPF